MHISVRRSGGFAGIDEQLGSVDTTRLEADVRQRVEELVEGASFFSLPAHAESIGADQFRYEVTVDDAGRRHAVTFDEEAAPPQLRALVEAVESLT